MTIEAHVACQAPPLEVQLRVLEATGLGLTALGSLKTLTEGARQVKALVRMGWEPLVKSEHLSLQGPKCLSISLEIAQVLEKPWGQPHRAHSSWKSMGG